jgi:transposase
MDNAHIHHGQEIEDLVHGYGPCLIFPMCSWSHVLVSGCRIEYLPPYSPDFNPIEQAWSVIKAHLRHLGICFYQPASPYYEMYLACELITPEMSKGFFQHAGYFVW